MSVERVIPYLRECAVCGSLSEGQAIPCRILDYMGLGLAQGKHNFRLKPYCGVCKAHTQVYVVCDVTLRLRYEGKVRDLHATP